MTKMEIENKYFGIKFYTVTAYFRTQNLTVWPRYSLLQAHNEITCSKIGSYCIEIYSKTFIYILRFGTQHLWITTNIWIHNLTVHFLIDTQEAFQYDLIIILACVP